MLTSKADTPFWFQEILCGTPKFRPISGSRILFLCTRECLHQMHISHTLSLGPQSAGHHALERKQQDEFVKQHEHEGSAGARRLGSGTE